MLKRFQINIEKYDTSTHYNVIDKKGEYTPCVCSNAKSAADYRYYMDNYVQVEKFIICRDDNNIYWIFVKSKIIIEGDNVLLDSVTTKEVHYIKQEQVEPYQDFDDITTGCNSLEIAKDIKKELYEIDKKQANSKIFSVVG